ncbi:LysM peptidoglycan-binding domain-containing protein [Corallincola holothuriorum]|uniref:LysM peptidoglycan-binding domain-containing protein n=1 Tax=Corallincola holothuriorum TaxID=2282215 RepID=UPI001314E9CA|nr:LysM domain-containing protein [Corallincola holothuriorum]
MRTRLLALVAGLTLVITAAYATEIELNPDYPETYIVQKGDTLWDISSMFLKTPWLWPKLWQANPQIDNPHLIYPGDELQLVWINEQPKLVKSKPSSTRIVKLGPKVRTSEPKAPIPTIPLKEIRPFLIYEQVLSEEEIASLPYVLGTNDGTTRSSYPQTMYAKGVDAPQGQLFGIYRPGEALMHPETEELLGYEAKLVAIAKSMPAGNFTKLEIVESKYEVRNGDKLIPVLEREVLPAFFEPHEPNRLVKGHIIHTANYSKYVGKFDVVAMSIGENHNIEAGHVLAIMQPGAVMYDEPPERPQYEDDANALEKMAIEFGDEEVIVQLPDERVGELLVFRVYEKVSYGLIMRTDKPVKQLDIVTNP